MLAQLEPTSREATNHFALYDALQGHIGEPIRWLAELPDVSFIFAALILVLVALMRRETLALLWASLSCLVVIAVLGTENHLPLIFMLFVIASGLLIVVRESFGTARDRHVLCQLSVLQQRIERLEFAAQNQFLRSLRDLKRPIAPGIVSLDQDQSTAGAAQTAGPAHAARAAHQAADH
jgi:hypothetical protein